ncbi:MFS transporter [Chloroflexota bacterium]
MRKKGIFYGWWIVGAAFFLALYTDGAVFWGFTAVFEPIVNEFGWSYTQISLAASIRVLGMALFVPFIGLFVDRWGPRRLLSGGAIVAGLGLMFFSRITSLGMFYGAFALVSLGISACSSTVWTAAIANWFRRKVGRAIGIMACGWGCSPLLVPVIVRLIDEFDWRMTMAILAVGMLVIFLPLSLLFRHKPEQYGYQPDGEVNGTVIPDRDLAPVQTAGVDIGIMQVIKSSSFWHIALAAACGNVVIGAVVTHVMPYLSSVGIDRATSSLGASAIGLLSLVGRLGFGWFADRADKRWLATGAFAIMSLGLLFFGCVADGGIWLLVPFVILFGIGYGGMITLRPALLREYFGRTRFGTVFGFSMSMMYLVNVLGISLPGWAFDNWGSYQAIWFVFTIFPAAAAIIVATTPPVRFSNQLVAEVKA